MESQDITTKKGLYLDPTITILILLQWLFFLCFIYAAIIFLTSGKPIDFVVVLFFLRWSITVYQLKILYNHGIVKDYMFAVLRKNLLIKEIQSFGRKKRRKDGIDLQKIKDSFDDLHA